MIPISNRTKSARARVWRLQPDAVLCEAAAHENDLAFSELYRRHYRDLRAFVFHFLGARHRHEDAEDVVQDAFVRAFDAVHDQRFSGDFRRWLFTIARNRSIDLLRGERMRMVSLETAGIEISSRAMDETREEFAWLVNAISELPERQRSALLLRELAGLSHEAIAEELGTTAASARQLISRAREGVRDAAERDGREHKDLRRELLAAAPVLPLAATGLLATTGTTAAGGSIAFGKLVATVLATLVVAGTAGTVSREVSDASGAPNESVAAASLPATGSGESGGRAEGSQKSAGGSKSHLKADVSIGELPKTDKRPSSAPGRPQHAEAAPATHEATTPQKPASTESKPEAAPAQPQPVKEIVDLPGKVVEHVTDGLSGSSPPDQMVGNVLTDVTDTLGKVTSGLLGSGAGSGAH